MHRDRPDTLQPHFVRPEPMTRQPRPVRGLLAFFDPLLGGPALVVEAHHGPARQGHVRHDEAHAPEPLLLVVFDLGDDPSGRGPTLRLIPETLVAHKGLRLGRPGGASRIGSCVTIPRLATDLMLAVNHTAGSNESNF
jgi:hypothetical protein